MLGLFKRKKKVKKVAYLPLHYTKVVLPDGRVIRAVSVQDEGGRLRIVDLSGKVIIVGG